MLPENTLEGFRYALGLGVDAVECDVHLTRDGRLAVIHDNTVDRTTNGSGKVAEMDFAGLRALDAGGGQTVPALEELLELIRGRCRLLCELKADGTEAPAADAVVARGMAEDVLFISFDFDRLANVRRRREDLAIGVVLSAPDAARLERALELGVQHVGVHYPALSLGAVRRLRQVGVEVGAWTPNELEDMKAVIALGATHVTTDRPDVLMEHLHRQRGR